MAEHQPASASSSPPPHDTRSITGAASLIGVATFTSRILGFIRDIVLAQLFGASASADAFYVAYRIPNLLRELFAEGSMSSAFIPVFTEYHTLRSKQETWELASAAFTTLLTIVTVSPSLESWPLPASSGSWHQASTRRHPNWPPRPCSPKSCSPIYSLSA